MFRFWFVRDTAEKYQKLTSRRVSTSQVAEIKLAVSVGSSKEHVHTDSVHHRQTMCIKDRQEAISMGGRRMGNAHNSSIVCGSQLAVC